LFDASNSCGVPPVPIATLPVGISKSPDALATSDGAVEPARDGSSVNVPVVDPNVPRERFAVAALKNNVDPSGVPFPPRTKSFDEVVG